MPGQPCILLVSPFAFDRFPMVPDKPLFRPSRVAERLSKSSNAPGVYFGTHLRAEIIAMG